MSTTKKPKSPTDNWPEIRRRSEALLPADVVAYIREVHKTDPHPRSQLISVLHRVQGHYGYLAADHLDAVAQLMGIPAAKVSGVATFYHFFRLIPRGKYMISVCMGTACYVKGAEQIVDRLRSELGIDYGQTTEDGLFTLQVSRCVGTCGLAPVVMINDRVHAKVTPQQIPGLLEQYRNEAGAG